VSWGVSNKASIRSVDFSSTMFILFNPFWKFLRFGNLACDFGGLIFGPGIFWGFVGSPMDFVGF